MINWEISPLLAADQRIKIFINNGENKLFKIKK